LRPRRSTIGNWKDGPSNAKGDAFETARSKLAYHTTINLPLPPEQKAFGYIRANKTSLLKALTNRSQNKSLIDALYKEIQSLDKPKVMNPIKFPVIPSNYRPHIINTYMFHKEKFTADGAFDKDKFRMVILSNERADSEIGDTFSPTVNPISVLTQLNLAAVTKSKSAAYDVETAFLETSMKNGKRMFIRIRPEVAQHWIVLFPDRAEYLHSDGCLYFELQSFIYGLHEAPKEFNDLLNSTIVGMGFNVSKADSCLYTKKTADGYIVLSVHVDDMLLTYPNQRWRDWFEKAMEKRFKLVKHYDNFSYLGISIETDKQTGSIKLSQKGMIKKILKEQGLEDLKKFPSTPASDTSFLVNEEEDDKVGTDKKKFLSLVMALMYLARFTRPDVLMPVSYLATKCSRPTLADSNKLSRIVRYLAGTIDEGLEFRSDIKFQPQIYADASHLLHPGGHGQEGIIITNGSAPVASRSVKIKLMTRSSSESELFALEEASTYAVWYKTLLGDLGITCQAIPIYQDNKSAIIMASQGPSFRRTKHLMGRETYVKERLTAGEIRLRYLPTKEMLADLLTKPLAKQPLNYLKRKLFIKRLLD
jgi:hypothetical protein